jgi:acylpyruvate hydrolase
MRLATLRTQNGTRAVRVDGDELVEVPGYADLGGLLATADWRAVAGSADGARSKVAGADFAPVVPRPAKILCLGLNYRSHIEEMGREIPSHPTLFGKYARALIGARDPIVLPPESPMVDWEVELAFVIGAPGRRVPAAKAHAFVAGFTVCNDVSMRDWQMRTLQFLQGKTWERSTPVGPWITTLDEIDGGIDHVFDVSCEVDGEVVQKSRTSDLIWGPAALVEYISTILTLEPGDIIATGTPSGVGMGRNPPVFLKPGQTVRTVIDGLGELVNSCTQED